MDKEIAQKLRVLPTSESAMSKFFPQADATAVVEHPQESQAFIHLFFGQKQQYSCIQIDPSKFRGGNHCKLGVEALQVHQLSSEGYLVVVFFSTDILLYVIEADFQNKIAHFQALEDEQAQLHFVQAAQLTKYFAREDHTHCFTFIGFGPLFDEAAGQPSSGSSSIVSVSFQFAIGVSGNYDCQIDPVEVLDIEQVQGSGLMGKVWSLFSAPAEAASAGVYPWKFHLDEQNDNIFCILKESLNVVNKSSKSRLYSNSFASDLEGQFNNFSKQSLGGDLQFLSMRYLSSDLIFVDSDNIVFVLYLNIRAKALQEPTNYLGAFVVYGSKNDIEEEVYFHEVKGGQYNDNLLDTATWASTFTESASQVEIGQLLAFTDNTRNRTVLTSVKIRSQDMQLEVRELASQTRLFGATQISDSVVRLQTDRGVLDYDMASSAQQLSFQEEEADPAENKTLNLETSMFQVAQEENYTYLDESQESSMHIFTRPSSNFKDDNGIFSDLEQFAKVAARASKRKSAGSEQTQIAYSIYQKHADLSNVLHQVSIFIADQMVESSLFAMPTGANLSADHGLILDNLESKQKQITIITALVKELLRQGLSIQDFLYHNLIDLNAKIVIAKVLRGCEQDLIDRLNQAKGDSAILKDIQLFHHLLNAAADDIKKDCPDLDRGLTSQSIVFSQISQIEGLFLRIVSVAQNPELTVDLASAQLSREDAVFFISQDLLIPVFKALRFTLGALDDGKSPVVTRGFIVDPSPGLLPMLVKFGDHLQNWNALFQYTEELLGFVAALGLERDSSLQPLHFQLRDTALLSLYNRRNPEALQAVIDLTVSFEAQQIFIKAIFEGGDLFFPQLTAQIQQWGETFLLLALRVVYVLDRKKIQAAVEHEGANYTGLQIFTMFEEAHYNELVDFLEIKNPDLLPLLKMRKAAQAENEFQKETLCKEVAESVVDKLSVCDELRITNIFSSLGANAALAVSHGEDLQDHLKRLWVASQIQIDSEFKDSDFNVQCLSTHHFQSIFESFAEAYEAKPTFAKRSFAFAHTISVVQWVLSKKADSKLDEILEELWSDFIGQSEQELVELGRMLPVNQPMPTQIDPNNQTLFTDLEIVGKINSTAVFKALFYLEEVPELATSQDKVIDLLQGQHSSSEVNQNGKLVSQALQAIQSRIAVVRHQKESKPLYHKVDAILKDVSMGADTPGPLFTYQGGSARESMLTQGLDFEMKE